MNQSLKEISADTQRMIKILSDQGTEVEIKHLRIFQSFSDEPEPTGGKTFASIKVAHQVIDGTHVSGVVYYGMALCSPKDSYVKKIGANLALTRAFQAYTAD